MNRQHLGAIVLLLAVSAGCTDGQVWSDPSSAVELLQVQGLPTGRRNAPALAAAIAALVDGRDTALGAVSTEEREDLRQLYGPDRAALWLDAGGRPTANMRDALTLLSHAADDGLEPSDYRRERVEDSIAHLDAFTPTSLARADAAISAGLLRYLRDLHSGRIDPRTRGIRLSGPGRSRDLVDRVRTAIVERRVLNLPDDLRPALEQYRRLAAALPHYRSLAADPGLGTIRPGTRAIHPGDRYAQASVLEQQLTAFGDLPITTPGGSDTGRYEGVLVEGVTRFQGRHGLDADGVLGKATIAALRVPVSWRVRQIELALERLRWLPPVGAQRLVALNIPMFRLWAWDRTPPNGAAQFGMDAIVGQALRTETPVFTAAMDEVIFRPYWNVPRSIVRKELLPKVERDPDYLRREDLEIVRGDSDTAPRVDVTPAALAALRKGLLRLRQRPGPKNALGLIKFVFPNADDVYMHGTPTPGLFAKSRRDFSHGCVRVADPVGLAQWVLQEQPQWTLERILAATTGEQTLHVKLTHPVQVILFYTTAARLDDGLIQFADDIYRQDARLDLALEQLHARRIGRVATRTEFEFGSSSARLSISGESSAPHR